MENKYYFSKIQLFEENEITMPSLKRKIDRKKKKRLDKLERQGILIGKNPTKLLAKAKRINAPQTSGDDVINVDQQLRKKWKIAMLRAQGTKVKDDVQILQKSVNKLKKIKRKKYEKWEDRKKQVEESKKEKQLKRRANIRARSTRKLSRKLQKAKERGRVFTID